MGAFQTLLALGVLIYVLSVIVQAVQEVIKSLLDTKAKTMEQTINNFMGTHLPLTDIQAALAVRGLDITALEHFNKDDFRHLLDAVQLAAPQVQAVMASANATAAQAKDNIASAYEAARATFQKSYTTRNKKWVIAISFLVVLALNANLIIMYRELAADQVMSQAIVGKADKAAPGQCNPENQKKDNKTELANSYAANRDCLKGALKAYPILARWSTWKTDWGTEIGARFETILGLLLMGILVSLGAPFWNDVLKGMMGVNNALNTNGKKTQ